MGYFFTNTQNNSPNGAQPTAEHKVQESAPRKQSQTKVVVVDDKKHSNKAPVIAKEKTQQCEAAQPHFVQLDELTHKRQAWIKRLAMAAKKVNVPQHLKERQMQLSGVPLDVFRQLTAPLNFDHYDLLPVNGKPHLLEGALQEKTMGCQFSRQYECFINLAESGQITTQTILGRNSILIGLIDADEHIKLATIERLMQAGLNTNFADLVFMTSKNAPLLWIERMVAYNKDPLDRTWSHHYRKNTLSMLAAETLNAPLFDYWLGLGSPLSTTEYDYTAMDVLKAPQNEQELESAIQIFVEIANRMVLPYKTDTLDKIKHWLPLEIQQQHVEYFNAHQNALLASLEPIPAGMIEYSQKLARYLGSMNAAITELDQKLAGCKIDRINNTAASKQTTDSDITAHNPSDTIDAFSQLDASQQQDILAQINLLKRKDWQGYVAKTDEMLTRLQDNGINTIALLQLIQANAPFNT
ncbi:MAG: hypothetical protein MJK04_05100 [Psychrosphaera sp.]|nr:hypothetical protein [Psychrosphaera sp.]